MEKEEFLCKRECEFNEALFEPLGKLKGQQPKEKFQQEVESPPPASKYSTVELLEYLFKTSQKYGYVLTTPEGKTGTTSL